MKRTKLFLIIVLSIGFLGASIFFFLSSPVFKTVDDRPLVVQLKKGMSAKQLVKMLSKTQQINCTYCLALYVRLWSVSNHLQAGVYQFNPSATPKQFIQKLLRGDVLKKKLIIKEGQLSMDVLDHLEEHRYLQSQDDLINQLHSKCKFCSVNIEGMFLANTYFYLAGSSSLGVLMRSHSLLKKKLTKIWHSREKYLPYKSTYELLIAASIIEKETAVLDEKKLISAVIVNRLKQNMRLQMDPTVIYGLEDNYSYPLKRKDLRINTPYNSYLNKGLPPTPIANVGIDALKAAAHPASVSYLYFVAKKNGRHQFSHNLAEQIKAIKDIRRDKKRDKH